LQIGEVLLLLIPVYLHLGYRYRTAALGVDVIAAERVGIYDVRVVRSGDPNALISWLNANEFMFTHEDRAVFDAYISRGWCFVVAKIPPRLEQVDWQIVSEGLAAPLILRFPHPNPVYPLALTGTVGHETQILLYLAGGTKMSCGDRLALRFSGKLWDGRLDPLLTEAEPNGFFRPQDLSSLYLCKFKATLTPGEMTTDIDFRFAGDTTDYQEHIVEWWTGRRLSSASSPGADTRVAVAYWPAPLRTGRMPAERRGHGPTLRPGGDRPYRRRRRASGQRAATVSRASEAGSGTARALTAPAERASS
jgi:hypothetical protein